MSIGELRLELKDDVPGIEQLVMRYEEGGRVQVFAIGKTSVRLGPIANADAIRTALREAIRT